jgi:hypothetical protein
MPLALRAITFNHDPDSATSSAMNIRRNKDFEVLVPEYDSAVPRLQEESCAAYSIADTRGQPVFIQVAFEMPASLPDAKTFVVRALGGDALGRIDPVAVTFPSGTTTANVECPLTQRTFIEVGRYNVAWRWQVSDQLQSTWAPLVTTHHRIYVVLAVPTAPWTQTFGDKRNPWTDLLEESSVRAARARTAVAAAKKIVRAVNSAYTLRYDIERGHYRYNFVGFTSPFRLSLWIDYVLRGNAPALPKFCAGSTEEYPDFRIVNCNDAATSVGLMGTIVGAPLEVYFHQPFGYLHYVLPIGRGKSNNPFYGCGGANIAVLPPDWEGPERRGFANHMYAKLPSGNTFDACLKESVPFFLRLLLLLLWLLIFILSLGTVNAEYLLDRADGWLVDLPQADYANRVNDTTQPFETAAAGGTPVLQPLDFEVT